MRLRISLRSVAKSLSTTTHHSNGVVSSSPVQDLTSFLQDAFPGTVVLTGAGVSTDSSIPDYRGKHGTYTLNPDYKPVFYQAFVSSDEARHRYWARSFLGFPLAMRAEPNPTHYAISALQSSPSSPSSPATCAPLPEAVSGSVPGSGSVISDTKPFVKTLITQNVDGLHQKAGSKDVIELHGTLHKVKCLSCGHEEDRTQFQHTLAALNPEWNALVENQSSASLYSRMNADGDVELKSPEQQDQDRKSHAPVSAASLDYRTFQYPPCACCGTGVYKPNVVFFGENIPPETKERAAEAIMGSNGLLVCGTSLATYSAFRLVKQARDVGVPVAIVNIGPCRGDSLATLRCDSSSSELMAAVVDRLGMGPVEGQIKRNPRRLNVVGS
ncbi:NAD+-dependent protein deacetylase sirtuin 4 [Entomortierella parvispora]|uniref:NAD+-dependent protein deacetylase sirtuin 4 n=1 Tax=Entomortierella parvispora TaxID=205924 RepID=A0A9P3HBK1_9FUNG|nr:NAD+-dependent protein deacetylase sirtuin 4 [Entomortierella parvispora]